MLEALLFDVDGTLAETGESHRAALDATFRAAGPDWEWDPALYWRLLQVAGGRERIRHYVVTHRLERARRSDLDALLARLHADKTRRFAEIVRSGELALRPGVMRLLREARACGSPSPPPRVCGISPCCWKALSGARSWTLSR